MSNTSDDDSLVKIHISFNNDNEKISIDFPFSVKHDDMDNVISDLMETLQISNIDKNELKHMIEDQIKKAQNTGTPIFEPIGETTPNNNLMSSDDEINDPEYSVLIQQQKAEMKSLLKRQYEEKKALAQRISASQIHLNQLNQKQPQASQPPIDKQDDLIVF